MTTCQDADIIESNFVLCPDQSQVVSVDLEISCRSPPGMAMLLSYAVTSHKLYVCVRDECWIFKEFDLSYSGFKEV